jgi:hypothetical protein
VCGHLGRYGEDVRWLVHLDVDEFIVPGARHHDIPDALQHFDRQGFEVGRSVSSREGAPSARTCVVERGLAPWDHTTSGDGPRATPVARSQLIWGILLTDHAGCPPPPPLFCRANRW